MLFCNQRKSTSWSFARFVLSYAEAGQPKWGVSTPTLKLPFHYSAEIQSFASLPKLFLNATFTILQSEASNHPAATHTAYTTAHAWTAKCVSLLCPVFTVVEMTGYVFVREHKVHTVTDYEHFLGYQTQAMDVTKIQRAWVACNRYTTWSNKQSQRLPVFLAMCYFRFMNFCPL